MMKKFGLMILAGLLACCPIHRDAMAGVVENSTQVIAMAYQYDGGVLYDVDGAYVGTHWIGAESNFGAAESDAGGLMMGARWAITEGFCKSDGFADSYSSAQCKKVLAGNGGQQRVDIEMDVWVTAPQFAKMSYITAEFGQYAIEIKVNSAGFMTERCFKSGVELNWGGMSGFQRTFQIVNGVQRRRFTCNGWTPSAAGQPVPCEGKIDLHSVDNNHTSWARIVFEVDD